MFQQHSMFHQPMYQQSLQQSSITNEVNNLYQDILNYQSQIDCDMRDKKRPELKGVEDRMDYSKKYLKESCGKRQPKQQLTTHQVDAPGTLLDWVDNDVKTQVQNNIKEIGSKNKEIQNTLLEVHELMELYAANQHKLNKNSAKELQLLKEMQNMKETLDTMQNNIYDVMKTVEFQEQNSKVAQLRKNQRVKDFDLQSYELLLKVKNDYFHGKILLDKNKESVEVIKKTLDEGR